MANLLRQLARIFSGKKEKARPEKVRLTVKDGKFVVAYYPPCITSDHAKYAMARQLVACYEIKLNGSPFMMGGLK